MIASEYFGIWNEKRNLLDQQLYDVDPQLAGLYQRAINLISTAADSGEEVARYALIGHCLRELMNSLPDALQDVEGLPVNRGREDERKLQKALVAEYEAFGGLPSEDISADKVKEVGQPKIVSVPQSLLDAVGNLVQSVNEGTTREAKRDSAAVLGRIDTRDPAVKPWKAARDFFMSFVHFRRDFPIGLSPKKLPSEKKILLHLEDVEATLRSRLGAFFDTLDELEDVIAQANESVEEDGPS